jgi:hypothetical protein
MAAAHQSSITYEFIIHEATKIQTKLLTSDTELHKQAATDCDRLWSLINEEAHEELAEAIAYECLFLTDARNSITRENNIENARQCIRGFIKNVKRLSLKF